MKLDSMKRRLSALADSGQGCPLCKAVASLTDEELDEMLSILAGKQKAESTLLYVRFPDSSPTCPYCRKAAGKNEEALDAELARLLAISEEHAKASEELARQEAQSFCDQCGSDLGGWSCYSYRSDRMMVLCRTCGGGHV